MASLSWDLTRRDGVTLVELVATAEAEEWIRVTSRLQPVWPPRRQGVPVAGWDGASFEGRVGPDAPLVLGYASPAAPQEPPARLEPVDADNEPPDGAGVSPRAIVRTLGESAPPRDVVPVDPSASQADGGGCTAAGTATADDPAAAIDPWLDAVEERLAEAERLADVAGVEEARGAVDTVGGIEGARRLRAQLEADRRHLRALGERQQRLADRLAAVEIPLSTLERVT
ncbi:hypothetical protein BRC87_03005 [Halobacteriales archaeon QS_4_66_20]|nr:MAG: hypothetical protein BRC87_03005 [Halobacteriales archaeon QS_4_66_20]